MARQFTRSSSQYLNCGSNSVHNVSNITLAAWAWADSYAAGSWNYIISREELSSPYGGFVIRSAGTTTAEMVVGVSTTEYKATASVPSTGGWVHWAGTYDGETLTLYLSGTSAGTNTAPSGNIRTTTAGTTTRISEGHAYTGRQWNGKLAEIGLWNRALSADEIAALADGFAPSLFPRGLISYWPLMGRISPEPDWFGGQTGTLVNTPTAADHPPKIIRSRRRNRVFPVAAGTSTFTGTATVTVGAATCSGSATHTAPTYTGNASATVGAATCSGSATHTPPTFSADGSCTVGAATCSGSATHTAPTYTGNASVTVGAATCSGSATHTAPTYTGNASTTVGAATCSGFATHTAPTYTGNGSCTVGAATCSGSATFSTGHSATSAVITGAATCSGSATHTPPTFSATGSPSIAPITCSGSATHTAPTYTGTGTGTIGAVTCTGSASFITSGSYTATATVTIGGATASGSGSFVTPLVADTMAPADPLWVMGFEL